MNICIIKVLPSSLLERISQYLPQEDHINLACVSRLFASIYQYHDADYWQSHFPQQVRMNYRTQRERYLVAKFCEIYAYQKSTYRIPYGPLVLIPKELRNIASLWWRHRNMQDWIPFGQSLIQDYTLIELMIAIVPSSIKSRLPHKNYTLYLKLNMCVIEGNINIHRLYSYNYILLCDRDYGNDDVFIRKYIRWSYLQLRREYRPKTPFCL